MVYKKNEYSAKVEKMKKPRKNREGVAGGEARKELQAFAARLRQARERAGLTQQQIAAAIGLSNYNSYQYWERAQRWPSAEYLAALCRILGVSSDILLGLQEETRGKMSISKSNE